MPLLNSYLTILMKNGWEFVRKSLWMIIENLYVSPFKWSLWWAGIAILVNNPYEGIPLSSYENIGEECVRFGRTIVTWYLRQASYVIIEAIVCYRNLFPMKRIESDVSRSANFFISTKCKWIIMHLCYVYLILPYWYHRKLHEYELTSICHSHYFQNASAL